VEKAQAPKRWVTVQALTSKSDLCGFCLCGRVPYTCSVTMEYRVCIGTFMFHRALHISEYTEYSTFV